MSNEKYELLMREMDSIARKLERFPDSLKSSAYKTMVETLLNEYVDITALQPTTMECEPETHESEVRQDSDEELNFSDGVREFYRRSSGATCNDMQFSAICAYFYKYDAPDPKRRDSIGPDQLEQMCRITRRRVPGNCRSTLNNAKNHKEFLQSDGQGMYSLTEHGKAYVKDKLL